MTPAAAHQAAAAGTGTRSTGTGPLSFRDVVIAPYAQLLEGPGGGFHKGGPAWPDWERQLEARHCRRARPIDERPTPAEPLGRIAEVAWGGAVSRHYGHQIADFSMRLLATSAAYPSAVIAFATKPEYGMTGLADAPAYLGQILAWYGVAAERFVLITEPTSATDLVVLPQAEQLGGPGPTSALLDDLDELTERRLGRRPRIACETTYVSRTAQRACFAGERYLEAVLRASGAHVVHPESLPIVEQMRTYHQSERLIFAEGSAIHTLQLGGRCPAEVAVLVRRPSSRIARELIEPRVGSLRYVEASDGIVHGVSLGGWPAVNDGVSVLDEEMTVAGFGSLGVDMRGRWDSRRFRGARDDDVLRWVRTTAMVAHHRSASSRKVIIESIAEAGLGHLVDRATRILDTPAIVRIAGRGFAALKEGMATRMRRGPKAP